MKFGIGQPVRRFEDVPLLTGKGQYTDDMTLPRMVFAQVLRSPMAHAHLRRVDATVAREMPGVLLVLTAADAAAEGISPIPCLIPLQGRDGRPRHDAPRPVLATGKVRHVGEPVAFVVAETLDQARDAAEAIEVDYNALPAVADVRTAVAAGAPQVFDQISGNVFFEWDNEQGDPKATAAGFAKAAHVVRLDLVNNRLVANPMEPRSAIGDFDAAADRLILYTPSQGPHHVRDSLADVVFKIPREKLRVITPQVGGGFGIKAFPYPEQALVLWAARKLQRPVKWRAERSETFLGDNQGRDHWSHAELALDRDGRFLAVRVETLANLGAYLAPFGPYVATRSTDLIPNVYKTPALHISVRGVCTNTVPVDAYRGAGRPEAVYVMERLVDAAARDLGLSQDEIRRRNFIPAAAMPFTTGTKVTYDTGDFETIMNKCMAAADWIGFSGRQAEAQKKERLRGIGLATYTERCGGGGTDKVAIEFKNGRVEIVMGNQEFGNGLITVYKQITADRLGIDPERIVIVMGDTDRTPIGLTGGSRGLAVGGSILHETADQVIEKGRRLAAHLLDADRTDVDYARHLDLFELADAARDPSKLPPGEAPGLDVTYEGATKDFTYPNGCHIAEVEIDAETGRVSLDRYTVVDDFGRVINPLQLEGQVHGGVVQGIGQALFEETVYESDSGQLLTGSFMDYCLPRASDLPSFAVGFHPVPSQANVLGVKGAGEAGAVGAPPAVVNAIIDALDRAAGIRDIDMPATARRVWEALQRARRR
jgi:carbon-monoxide dehydrogenase large subunit